MSDQLTLTCTGSINKRPERTEEMRRQAATKVAESIFASDGASGAMSPEELAESVEDIVKATSWGMHDGYKIARELERRFHWDCDMNDAEELDGFSGALERIYDAAEKVWAAENPRDPKFSDGDAVIWRGKAATVRCVYRHRPQCYEILQGEMRQNSAYIVPFEDVTAAAEGHAL